jgi:lysophospholipase L1-like esterase
MKIPRRHFVISAGALLAGCGAEQGAEQPPPPVVPPTAPDPLPPVFVNEDVARLQRHMRLHAVADLALPPLMPDIPVISWATELSGALAGTSMPDARVLALSNPVFGKSLAQRMDVPLPGNPQVDGFPVFKTSRSYLCKGQQREVDSVPSLRMKTDARIIELAGVIPEGQSAQVTLIVDGLRTAPVILSSSRGSGGGWNFGAVRIEFASRKSRDIWAQVGAYIASVRLDPETTVLAAPGDEEEPQVTVVGDSYLQMNSSVFCNGGAVALGMAARLGIRKVATDAVGGTGYWNSGDDLGNLNDRLPAHAADGSQLYLVMSGLNDYADRTAGALVWPAPATYEQSIRDYLQGLRSRQPAAVIAVTAPFCPIPPLSDSSYAAFPGTNNSGLGDYLYKAMLFRNAVMQLAPPWIYIDVLMGGGWLNSSGRSGDITNLQWLTGGTAGPGTTATHKPGNTQGGGGGGFGGIASIPVMSGGRYRQAPEIVASGGGGSGLLLSSRINAAGVLTGIAVISPGNGYSAGGLPSISIDPRFEIEPATLGAPRLLVGINPDGQYPLLDFAPPGVQASQLNNIYTFIGTDGTHPSPPGVEYLAQRLARNIHDAIVAL